MPLTGKQRHHLRALAHHLDPIVQIGHEGVSAAVVAQIDGALSAHELIKVRIGAECPLGREEAAEAIAAGARAEIAQVIGRIVVVWRRRPTQKKAKIALSAHPTAQKGSKGRAPGQRARAKARTAVARAAKRRKRQATKAAAGSRGGNANAKRGARGEAPNATTAAKPTTRRSGSRTDRKVV
jgi:RNA-binding protein